mgnify:FL=1|tara:strand:+ start:403 stop:615 length:213 start_codon:yes stop_codon:yes gene_type:complete
MTYIAGEAYEKGYKARMGGAEKASNVYESTSVYWQEWATGWDDAHNKIITEARSNAGCSKPKCCKTFIQE